MSEKGREVVQTQPMATEIAGYPQCASINLQ